MGISIGNKLELVLLDQVIKNDKNRKVYVSKIYDIITDKTLQIAMPIYEGKIVPLPLDEKYSACFYTDKGLLQCNVIVTSRYKSGNLFFLEIMLLGELTKVQRREFYRYNCFLDAKLRIVSDNEFTTGIPDQTDIPESDLDWQPVKMLDVSGGGAKIVSKLRLDRNEVVKLQFVVSIVDEFICFNLFARILGNAPVQGRSDLFELRLEFMKIRQEERDKIIRYIFESERMQRKMR